MIAQERWVRITYAKARARFFAGETVYFCPNKSVPGGPWQLEARLEGPCGSTMQRPTMDTQPCGRAA